jgi:hypothetical protein
LHRQPQNVKSSLKNEEASENFKTIGGSPDFDLPNHAKKKELKYPGETVPMSEDRMLTSEIQSSNILVKVFL